MFCFKYPTVLSPGYKIYHFPPPNARKHIITNTGKDLGYKAVQSFIIEVWLFSIFPPKKRILKINISDDLKHAKNQLDNLSSPVATIRFFISFAAHNL